MTNNKQGQAQKPPGRGKGEKRAMQDLISNQDKTFDLLKHIPLVGPIIIGLFGLGKINKHENWLDNVPYDEDAPINAARLYLKERG